jgi:hypothetical protein
VDGMHLPRDRDQWLALVMKLWVPEKDGNFLSSQVIINFARRTLLHGTS